MVFKSDKQRKKVMALLRGNTKSDVSPLILKRKMLVESKEIPALTGTLGRAQPAKDAKAFRVWVHPSEGGDDFFFEFDNLERAKRFRNRATSNPKFDDVEPVIGVFRKNLKKFPKQKWWEARILEETKQFKTVRVGEILKHLSERTTPADVGNVGAFFDNNPRFKVTRFFITRDQLGRKKVVLISRTKRKEIEIT